MKKALVVWLVFLVAIGLLAPAFAATGTETLTRRELSDILIAAADDYHPAEAGAIIRGDENGQLRHDDQVTRIEALVMLRRAFGQLPALSSNRLFASLTDTGVSFADVPEWARQDIDVLTAAGLLVNTEDGLLHGEDYVTEEEVKILLRRVWMLFGAQEKDDFFAAHEKESINKAVQYPGFAGVGDVYNVYGRQDQRIDGLLDEILAAQWPQGSDQQKIKDYYTAALAVCSGSTSDLSPIRSYLDAVDSAQGLADLLDILGALYADTGFSAAFFDPYIDPDSADSSRNVLWLNPEISPLDAGTYSDATVSSAAAEYFEKVLLIGGEAQTEAAAAAKDILAYQKALAAVQVVPENYNDVNYYYNAMPLADADARLKNIDLGALLMAFGYSAPDRLVIDDLGAFEYLCGYLADENLAALKNILKYSILNAYGDYLSSEFYEAQLEFSQALYGDIIAETAEDRARAFLLQQLDVEIGKLYVVKYFDQEDKELLAEIERAYVEAFRERIKVLDWMGAAAKEQAIAKLEAITFKNIWPDYWFTDQESKYIPAYDIVSGANGGSFYSNYTAVSRAYTGMNIAAEGTPVDKTGWDESPLTVNAAYSFEENGVYILAGWLDDPLYDDSSLETILGSVGTIIGHEMTHAFDNAGAKFDADGNAADWWTAEDYAAFTERCGKVAELFDRMEAAPGILASGEITLGENVADLGGLALSLDVAQKLIEEPDYETFFISYADSWCASYPRQTVSFLTAYEFQSMPWLRVNVPLMQLEQFYKTYGITDGDGMYLPPEERVAVW